MSATCPACQSSDFVAGHDGTLGTALMFSSSGPILSLADEVGQYPAFDFSISFWLKVSNAITDTTACGEAVVLLDIDATNSGGREQRSGYFVQLQNNGRRIQLLMPKCLNDEADDNWNWDQGVTSTEDLVFGTWTRVLIVRSGRRAEIFYDGVKVQTSGQVCSGRVSFDGGAYEDHSSSIGHYQRAFVEPTCFSAGVSVEDLRLYDYVASPSALDATDTP